MQLSQRYLTLLLASLLSLHFANAAPPTKPQSDLALALKLAELHKPNKDGAIGRNKDAYIHVRFQLGLHHLSNYGIAAKEPKALQLFDKAAHYSFKYQNQDGSFALNIPPELKRHGKTATPSENASGTAFFVSSLGSGLIALENSHWVQSDPRLAPLREHASQQTKKLRPTLSYLLRNQAALAKLDAHAPNRLLFDATAFHTLGKLLSNKEAHDVADTFVALASKQIHPDGYFIEGGGYDSSYNGVATALCYRLLILGYPSQKLGPIAKKSLDWQLTRIAPSGEILTTGNARVNPSENSETFLGRPKDVDVGHTLEALTLAAIYHNDTSLNQTATRVLNFYLQK